MKQIKLPLSIPGKKELILVQREIEHVGEQMIQTRVTGKEINQARPLPTLSEAANELLYTNDMELKPSNVDDIIKQLEEIKDTAPILRVSFASEPDLPVLSKLIGWFRQEVDQSSLLQVGIQPSIAGGCIVQTPTNRYDFSLRRHIMNSSDKFKKVIAEEVFKKKSTEDRGANQQLTEGVPAQDNAQEAL